MTHVQADLMNDLLQANLFHDLFQVKLRDDLFEAHFLKEPVQIQDWTELDVANHQQYLQPNVWVQKSQPNAVHLPKIDQTNDLTCQVPLPLLALSRHQMQGNALTLDRQRVAADNEECPARARPRHNPGLAASNAVPRTCSASAQNRLPT